MATIGALKARLEKLEAKQNTEAHSIRAANFVCVDPVNLEPDACQCRIIGPDGIEPDAQQCASVTFTKLAGESHRAFLDRCIASIPIQEEEGVQWRIFEPL